MNPNRQTWLVLLLAPLCAVAVKLGEDRGYIPAEYNAVSYIVLAGVLIFLAVQVRRENLVMPAAFRALKVGKLALVGGALVLISLAWFAVGFAFFSDSAPAFAALPPVLMFVSGLFLLFAALLFRILRVMFSR